MASCSWKKLKVKAGTPFTEWQCLVCHEYGYTTTGKAPVECKSPLKAKRGLLAASPQATSSASASTSVFRPRAIRGGSNSSKGGFRKMKPYSAFVVIGLALFGYPMINEETPSLCHAVERRFVIEAARTSPQKDIGSTLLMGMAGEISNGALAAGFVKGAYPDIPPFLGCTFTYYKMLTDPNFVQQMARRIRAFGQ